MGTEEYDGKLENEREMRIKLTEEKEAIEGEFEDVRNSVEVDADAEIEMLKAHYQKKVEEENLQTLRLKGENGIMKKKYSSHQKDIEDQKEEIKTMTEREKDLYEQIRGLEKDIQGHKKEIRERDETISDKENRIYDLKKKNKELKRQIEPRENEIADMKEQIKEMDQELQQYHKSNAALDLMIGELKLKMDGMNKETEEQKRQIGDGDSLISRFKNDLSDTAQHLTDHKHLKHAITSLYKKYVQEMHRQGPEAEADLQREYNRQREYLEKTVESLKRKLAKDMEMHRNDNMRLMRESVVLTGEINSLRREIDSVKQSQARRELENRRSNVGSFAEGSNVFNDEAFPSSAAEAQRELEMQRQHIEMLRDQVAKLEAAMSMA